MKNAILTTCAVLISGSVFATGVPGAITLHNISCQSVDHKLGVDVLLQCQTQALAPEYSLRGCNLQFQVVGSKAKPRIVRLTIENQTADKAELSGAAGLEVDLQKSNLSADVYQNGRLEYRCE